LSILLENLETGAGPRADSVDGRCHWQPVGQELADHRCHWRLVGQYLADHRAATTWIERLLGGDAGPVKRAPKSRARGANAPAGVR
jgi:hypothetical protein